jgi:hypothetical protein
MQGESISFRFKLDHMTKTRDEILENRRRLKAEYGELFDAVAALLFRHDPIGIVFDGDINTDEYEPEAGSILPRLRACHSSEDVQSVVHSEFVGWFGEEIVGSKEYYKGIASEIWELWQQRLAKRPSS